MALTQLTIGDARFRAGRWRGRADLATLIPLTDARTLHRESLRAARAVLQNQGFSAVVTGPVGPPERTAFMQDDFSEREQLHLLHYDLQPRPRPGSATGRTIGERHRPWQRRRPRTRRATRRDWDEILAVDQQSFDDFWHFDRDGLKDSIEATPASRLRIIRGSDLADLDDNADSADPPSRANFTHPPERAADIQAGNRPGRPSTQRSARSNELLGYALAGHSGGSGYLQRLAVHPACRQQGIGTLLVHDALWWIRRRGAVTGWVNTQKTNESALRLYQKLGFTLQEHPLTVMYRTLT